MAEPTHDPDAVATGILRKLSSRDRHVSVVLGAGASRSAGVPDIPSLMGEVKATISGKSKDLLDKKSLEEALSFLRQLREILAPGQTFEGWSIESVDAADAEIVSAFVEQITAATIKLEPFVHLARWVAGSSYLRPIEFFTTNYDLLIENGHEAIGQPYFDGFVGVYRASFRADLIDLGWPALDHTTSMSRIWKLHGSMSWILDSSSNPPAVVRSGAPAPTGQEVVIHPSFAKYEDSRRVPFVVLFDRFRRALAMPESMTLVSGYSFGDEHVNEVIFSAAEMKPRSETVIFCHGAIPAKVGQRAIANSNISVLAAKEAILGGVRGNWTEPADDGTDRVHWDTVSASSRLGDFAQLARFLSQQWTTETVSTDD